MPALFWHREGAKDEVVFFFDAEVVKLVDTHVSGACAARYAGSSPAFGTLSQTRRELGFFFLRQGGTPMTIGESRLRHFLIF